MRYIKPLILILTIVCLTYLPGYTKDKDTPVKDTPVKDTPVKDTQRDLLIRGPGCIKCDGPGTGGN